MTIQLCFIRHSKDHDLGQSPCYSIIAKKESYFYCKLHPDIKNDTDTPVQQGFRLHQRLTELKHPDHTLITYPNLGHQFYPSSQWSTANGPIQQYVLADFYLWLEAHSGFTNHGAAAARLPATSMSSSNATAK